VAKESLHKIRAGIVMGGRSSEREVSLESGRNIVNKLPRAKYEPVPIFMDRKGRLWEIDIKLLMRNSTGDIEEDLATEALPLPYESLGERVEVVVIGLHGKYGEDGCFQGLLELLGVPYTGSGVLASAVGMDKFAARRLLSLRGFDVPKTIPFPSRDTVDPSRVESLIRRILGEFGFPCIVKPAREGCSTAVAKVENEEGLDAALKNAGDWDELILIEEFITGVEVTCGVLDEEPPLALIPSETIPTTEILSLEDKFLYGQGENKTPARLPGEMIERIQETARAAFVALGLRGYARIDMFVRPDGRVSVLEPNTLPGLTPSTVLFHQAAACGFTPAELLDRIITAALAAHGSKRGPL